MSYTIHNGDCLTVLPTLPAASVHCCVTSPPYYGMRNYNVDGQMGLEASPQEYVDKLVAVFREVKRVLRDDGTLWINLGDSYTSTGETGRNDGADKYPSLEDTQKPRRERRVKQKHGLKPKNLLGMPWRVAFALQQDGWYLRSDIIWHKSNCMPESVKDRPTKSHEYIFLLAKQERYYYDNEAVREPHKTDGRGGLSNKRTQKTIRLNASHKPSMIDAIVNPGGRNRRSVWTIPTQAYKGAHFAVFPAKLIEPCILAGTSEKGCCPSCGSPWRRVVERTKYEPPTVPPGVRNVDATRGDKTRKLSGPEYNRQVRVVGESWHPSCSCSLEPVPCKVLDPFAGVSTTGLVALKHGREFIGVELSPDYVKLSQDRLAKSPK